MGIGQDEVNVRVTGSTGSVDAAMRQAANSVRDASERMKSHVEGITGAFEKLNVAFAAIGAVLAGGAAFREGVEATVEMTKESQALAKQLGITATQASVLRVALGDTYVSQEAVSAASSAIARTLRTNEAAITSLGVATRDSNGNYRDSLAIMSDVNEKLKEFKEGTDRNVEGQKVYGRQWAEVASTLRLTKEAMEEAQQKAEDLHIIVGEESIDATKKYRAAMNDVGDVFEGMKKAIGDALLPILTQLGNWFASIGPQAVAVMRAAMWGLVAAFYGVKLAIETAWGFMKAAVQQMVVLLLTLAEVGWKALKFDFSGAKEAWTRGTTQMRDIGQNFLDGVVADWEDAQSKITDAAERMFGKETPTTAKDGKASSGGEQKGKKGETFDETLAKGRLRMEREIAAEVLRINKRLQSDLEQFDKQSEKRYEKEAAEREKKREKAAQQLAQSLTKMFDPIGQAFEGMLTGVLNGTQTIQQAFSRMGLNIAASIGNMVAQAVANFIKMKVVAIMTGRDASLAQVKQNAATAASAAYQSAAKIPYVGWILGPIAAAAAYAGVLAFGSSIPSARSGYDVPAGVNPMTQIHEREMVLPAKYADVIRAQAEGGKRGKGFTFSPTINAIDGDGVRRLFQSSEFQGEFRRFAGRFA